MGDKICLPITDLTRVTRIDIVKAPIYHLPAGPERDVSNDAVAPPVVSE